MNPHDIVMGRLAALTEAWGLGSADPVAAAAKRIDEHGPDDTLWQVASTVAGEFVSSSTMRRFGADVRIMGPAGALERLIQERELADADKLARGRVPVAVEFADDAYLVDVHDTCRTTKTTGIQRVVREVAQHWVRDHDVRFVAWTTNGEGFRNLSDWETNSLLALDGPHEGSVSTVESIVIPLGGTLTVAELAAEDWRATRLDGLVAYGGLEVNVIGYDCVPMTASETAADPIAASFPIYLNAISRADRIAAISSSAAIEFTGWRRMLAAAGVTGPEVRTVELAAEIAPPTEADLERARTRLAIQEDVPMVLVVGSHEPRKNHLAVLQAARMLWKEGVVFELVFVGGMSWRSERFHEEVIQLQRDGKAVRIVSGANDAFLAAAYRLAAFTVFPSLHEGYGLPVAESLSLGTPVITSGFGSMRDLVEQAGGGLMVDPLDDTAIRDAMRSLLHDDALRDRLATEARQRHSRTWDEYTADLWDSFAQPLSAPAEARSAS